MEKWARFDHGTRILEVVDAISRVGVTKLTRLGVMREDIDKASMY